MFIPLFLLAFFPKHFFSSSGFPKVLPFFNVGSCSSSCALPLLHFPNIGCCSSSCLPKFAFFTLALPFFRLFLFALFFNFFLYVYVILVGRNSTVAIVGVMVSSSLHFGCVSLLALYIFGTPLTLWFGTFCFHCWEEKDKTCVDKIYFFLPFTNVF